MGRYWPKLHSSLLKPLVSISPALGSNKLIVAADIGGQRRVTGLLSVSQCVISLERYLRAARPYSTRPLPSQTLCTICIDASLKRVRRPTTS